MIKKDAQLCDLYCIVISSANLTTKLRCAECLKKHDQQFIAVEHVWTRCR